MTGATLVLFAGDAVSIAQLDKSDKVTVEDVERLHERARSGGHEGPIVIWCHATQPDLDTLPEGVTLMRAIE